MIPGIVLAAGRSSRMGRAKALLPIGPAGTTFLERVVETLTAAGVERIITVLGGSADEIRLASLPLAAHVQLVENPDFEQGQLSSLIAGLNAAAVMHAEAVLVTLIDMPLVSPATVRAVLDARTSRSLIVRACHGGRHGHPVLFDRALFAELRDADPGRGAKQVLQAHATEVLDLDVPDPGVIIDIDTWADYERHIGPRP